MQKINNNKKGFSLIELMVVVAIVAIMTSVTLISMNALREKKAVETAAREVAAVVREAQNNALTGKYLKDIGATGCVYTFSWSGAGYNISGCKNQIYTLKNGVNFIGSGSVSFSVPFSTTSPADIVLSKGSSNYHVCVYASGIVKELDAC